MSSGLVITPVWRQTCQCSTQNALEDRLAYNYPGSKICLRPPAPLARFNPRLSKAVEEALANMRLFASEVIPIVREMVQA